MNLLVLGATGFIGGRLAAALDARGDEAAGPSLSPFNAWVILKADLKDDLLRCLEAE